MQNPVHAKLLILVKEERKALAQILRFLKIIRDQNIYTKMGYSSLLKYCIKKLKYSESAAYRRIGALSLERKIPNITKEIEAGTINLGTATKLNTLLDYKSRESGKSIKDVVIDLQKSSADKNTSIIGLITGKTSSDAEALLREELKLEQKKKILKIEMSEESYREWIEYKGKHIAKRLTDEALLLHAIRSNPEKFVRQYTKSKPVQSKKPRYIETRVRREVYKLAKNRCQHPKCSSTYGLEIDHKIPVNRGGRGKVENLQILCRNHNQLKSNQH